MSHRWLDHTAELVLELEAPTEEALFAEAVAALAELLGPARGEPVERAVAVEAADRPALLVDWLNEVLYVADAHAFVPDAAEVRLEGDRLDARVRGRAGTPRPLVKAVTYHDLVYEEVDGGRRARLVLDV